MKPKQGYDSRYLAPLDGAQAPSSTNSVEESVIANSGTSEFTAGSIEYRAANAAPQSMNLRRRGHLAIKDGVLFDSALSLDGVRVLVVDDKADVRHLLTTMLRDYGAEVTPVALAGEALDALQQLKPDVLIIDIEMPNENGYKLIRQVRSLKAEQGGKTPAVALMTCTAIVDWTPAYTAGFHLHALKPFKPTEIAAAVVFLAERVGR